jgi:hypothetical protein
MSVLFNHARRHEFSDHNPITLIRQSAKAAHCAGSAPSYPSHHLESACDDDQYRTLTPPSQTRSYNGSSSYGPSSASLLQIVESAATTTTLTSSLNPAPYGQTVTFTAVVMSAVSATPSGTVTIKDGKKVLGSASLVNGQIQISTSLLAEGSHTLTATYSASANFLGSRGTLSQSIQ